MSMRFILIKDWVSQEVKIPAGFCGVKPLPNWRTRKMHVVVRTIGPFSDQFGFQQLTVNFKGRTVNDLLGQLCEERGQKFCNIIYEADGRLRRYIKVLVNGRGLHVLQGLETPLSDGDVVALFPPVAGGIV